MGFVTGVAVAMGLLVAGTLYMIASDPGYLPEPMQAAVEPATVEMAEPTPSGPLTHVVIAAEGSSVAGCELTNECYIPPLVEASVGDIIVWENPDTAAHTVTSITDGVPDGIFESGLFVSGATFEVTLQEAGTYDYFCIVHPWMVGTVIVQ